MATVSQKKDEFNSPKTTFHYSEVTSKSIILYSPLMNFKIQKNTWRKIFKLS